MMIYPRRYIYEPRKRKAYCEACDLVGIYGCLEKSKLKHLDLCASEITEIWQFAVKDMHGNSKYDFIGR